MQYHNSESDNESIYEDINDEYIEIFSRPIATQKWNDKIVSYYLEDARFAIANISCWSFNRSINIIHKDSIKEAIKENLYSPHLMGTIQVVRDMKKQIRVINGQHRLKAIEDVIRDDIDMICSFKIMFEVYDININDLEDVTEDHSEIETLFKTANHTLNFDLSDDINIVCREIVINAKRDKILGNGIVDKKEGTVHKPKITMKDFYEILKKSYPHGGWELETLLVVNKLKQINVHISMMSNKELFGRDNPSEKKLKQLQKARKLNFYLNIDSRFPPEVWIHWIKNGVPN